jgi:hypothetical protein
MVTAWLALAQSHPVNSTAASSRWSSLVDACDKAVAGASLFAPQWGILLTPVAGLGASKAAGLKLAVWRQSTVAVPGRSPSSHNPTPRGSWPGYSSNEAPPDIADALALGPPAGSVGAGLWAASERSRPAYDQLTRTWAALIGPMPGSSSSHRATRGHQPVQLDPRLDGLGGQQLAAVGGGAQRLDGHAMLQRPGGPVPERGAVAIWRLVARPRSSARSSSGAPTISALSWLMAQILAAQALWRLASSTRIASRSPGWTGCLSGQQSESQVDAGTHARQLVTRAARRGA